MCHPGWQWGLGENVNMYMYGYIPSLFTETITTLLIGYTPIQSVFAVKKKWNKSNEVGESNLEVINLGKSFWGSDI